MPDAEFYSHIHKDDEGGIIDKKTLIQHLSEVVEHAKRSVSQLPPRFSQNDNFRRLVELACLCHDFGKFTSFFQKYLLEGKKQGTKHHHGFTSALFTAFQVDSAELTISPHIDPYLPLISYLCVLHHHGNLGNLDRDIIKIDDMDPAWHEKLEYHQLTNIRNAEAQIEDMKGYAAGVEDVCKKLLPDHSPRIKSFTESWMDTLSMLDRMRYRFSRQRDTDARIQAYIHLLFIYSILIDADKKSAADVDVPPERRALPSSLVDDYRNQNSEIDTAAQEGINEIRNEIYARVISAVDAADLDAHHIMTLTAPTGTGKTLSAFSAALKLRSRIEHEKGFKPRIIYSLPFTSIIDQNFDVIHNVLLLLKDYQDSQQEHLLKHHYLSNIEFKSREQEMEPDDAILLIESWESEIVVTTFVQMLQTIIGFRNKSLKKYHKIAGSVIILDEVQNIPVEYWDLVSNALKLLCSTLDCYVILLTATKPLLFDENECLELLEGNKEYFSHFHRTQLKAKMEGMSLDDVLREFINLYDGGSSFLIVANTIKSSLYFYERIAEFVEDNPVYYLSSNIVPRYRRQRVEEVSEALENNQNPVLVSTQVVEAGVDLDFDTVIRDLGPIDSIVQVAGRCNRSGKRSRANVYVYNIVDDRNRSLSTYVYGAGSTNAARDALAAGVYVEETYHTLVDEFFKSVKELKSQQQSRDIWNAAAALRFHSDERESVSDFSLIESLPNMVDVFVQVDGDAVNVWEEYEEKVLNERDVRKKRLNFMSMKAAFHSHIISIPGELAKELIPVTGGFYLLPHQTPNPYYDCITGFNRIPEETTWIL